MAGDAFGRGGVMFPRLQKRGPIEASGRLRWLLPAGAFPRLQKRGPIEALMSYATLAQIKQVSTLTKAWPH